MLALSHHILVQIAAHRVGYKEWFSHYALLGDDIVIAEESVARAYLSLMQGLGVPINLSKSFEMDSGGLEFAKRWINPWFGDISPMSPGLVLAAVRNPRMLSSLFQDLLGRGFVISTRVVSDLVQFLHMIRPGNWFRREWGPIFSTVFGPTGGLWETASGPLFKAIWIKSFPHRMYDKLDELIDILYRLITESQKPPLSEEESKKMLTSNFWKQVLLLGPTFRGLIWVPLLILSPAFWVYYDLANRAEERMTEFQSKLRDLETCLWGREWFTLDGLAHAVRAESLAKLVKSTFDPGLLDWDRKVAELSCRLHKTLIKEWHDRVKVLKMSAEVTANYSKVIPVMPRRQVMQTIPTIRSLVPLGAYMPPQMILLRRTEVPQGTISAKRVALSAGRTFRGV
jgi:hypothetical protein